EHARAAGYQDHPRRRTRRTRPRRADVPPRLEPHGETAGHAARLRRRLRQPHHRHQPHLRRRMTAGDRRQVAAWLFVCAAFTFAMVVVGGITRLTESGLSIVEWQPIVGALPPLQQADWEALFAQYRETPQYQKVFSEIGLEGFKSIFWWEYAHRLLGRTIGLVFLLPFSFFLFKKKLSKPLAWKLGGLFVLGGLQGAMGWYMVKSGLVDDPRVSHFRLTAHLGLALLIFGAMQWVAMSLWTPA